MHSRTNYQVTSTTSAVHLLLWHSKYCRIGIPVGYFLKNPHAVEDLTNRADINTMVIPRQVKLGFVYPCSSKRGTAF